MCGMNNCGNCSWIIILILLFICCGNNGCGSHNDCGSSCGCGC